MMDEIIKYMGRRRLPEVDRRKCVAVMNLLIGAGFTGVVTIPWWVYRDWGICRVFADCFNTPGQIRLYWKDASLGTPEIARNAITQATVATIRTWFPHDDFGVTQQSQ